MLLEVRRTTCTGLSTIGEMWLDGVRRWYTLEPVWLNGQSQQKPRAIPAGTYDLTVGQSSRFHRLMPHIENVPDFDGILIHWGNYPHDTEGCILVGKTRGPQPDFIGNSRCAFDELFPLVYDACQQGQQYITITDVA